MLPLDSRDRSDFTNSVEPLDQYLRTQVAQNMKRRVAACTVAVERASGTIAGFHTLSVADLPLADLRARPTKRAPRYSTLPAACLDRLAVDLRFHDRTLGAALLADAVLRAAASEVAVGAMIVNAKDKAAAFYHHQIAVYASAPCKIMVATVNL